MRDPTTYQWLMEKNLAPLHGTLMRQGRKKWGEPTEAERAALFAIEDVELLENLAEKLLDANSWQDLLPHESAAP